MESGARALRRDGAEPDRRSTLLRGSKQLGVARWSRNREWSRPDPEGSRRIAQHPPTEHLALASGEAISAVSDHSVGPVMPGPSPT